MKSEYLTLLVNCVRERLTNPSIKNNYFIDTESYNIYDKFLDNDKIYLSDCIKQISGVSTLSYSSVNTVIEVLLRLLEKEITVADKSYINIKEKE